VAWRPRASEPAVPPAGMLECACRPKNTRVFKNHFPKSDPVSAQAVALGGQPLKRKTVVAAVEGDLRSGFWGRTAVMLIEAPS